MNLVGRTYRKLLKDSLSLWVTKPSVQASTRQSSCVYQSFDFTYLPLAAQQRHQHTVTNLDGLDGMSNWQRMKWNMGFHGNLRVAKRHLKISGLNLYVCCTDFIDFNEFVKEARVPDTFNGWFILLQLHMWMLLVKLNQMGKEGVLVTQYVYQCMWNDVERRLNTFQELLGSEKRHAMKDFHSIMCSSILNYDEGLMSSDQVLSNSLWVQLYGMDPELKAEELELMVEYVRKQIHHLDHQDPFLIMKPGYISFLPLIGDRIDQEKTDRQRKSLLNP